MSPEVCQCHYSGKKNTYCIIIIILQTVCEAAHTRHSDSYYFLSNGQDEISKLVLDFSILEVQGWISILYGRYHSLIIY